MFFYPDKGEGDGVIRVVGTPNIHLGAVRDDPLRIFMVVWLHSFPVQS